MYTIRRYPGLKCEKCGSDEFELDVNSALSPESVEHGESYPVELRLCCAHCPRVIPICGLKSADGFSYAPNNPATKNKNHSAKKSRG